MKRIVFLNRFFHPDHSATSQILSDLTFHLARTGWDVAVVTSQQRYDNSRAQLPAVEVTEGVTVHRVPTTQFGRSRLIGRGLDYASFYASLWKAANRLAGRGDILVAMTDPPMLGAVVRHVANHRRAHLVNWLQDLYPEVAAELNVPLMRGPFGRALGQIRDLSLRAARSDVVIGERMATRLVALEIPRDRIRVIPNWCADPSILPQEGSQNPLRQAWGLAGKFVVGYSGNLGRAHEFETILDAARRLGDQDNLVFLMIGGGHFIDQLSCRVRELRLDEKFRFLPYQDQPTLKTSLAVPDVYWISLKPALEGLIVPSKFYSIAAAGRPIIVVGAEQGELADLVRQHDCGFVVEPGQSEALADLLRRLAKNPDELATMGKAARTMLDRHFSRDQALHKWEDLINEISALPAFEGPS